MNKIGQVKARTCRVHQSPFSLQETPTCPTTVSDEAFSGVSEESWAWRSRKLPEFRTTERSRRTPTSPRAPEAENAKRRTLSHLHRPRRAYFMQLPPLTSTFASWRLGVRFPRFLGSWPGATAGDE